MRASLALGFLLAFVLAGCSGGTGNDAEDEDDGPHEVEPSWLAQGILYRNPGTGKLAAVDVIPPSFALQVGGFDWADGVVAQGDNEEAIRLQGVGARTVAVDGIHHIGRASLDPEAEFAVVQATTGTGTPGPPTNDFNVYVVNLADGTTTRIGSSADNEESPEWSPDGARIAYSSFSPADGIDLHLVDPATQQETRRIDDAGGIHLSFSPDGSSILESGRLRVYDVATGDLTHDLRDEARAGAVAAGYQLEDRFPGQANRGTFPLDGDFSRDGARLVFDGAVKQGAASAIIVATMALDGTGFEVVAGPFTVDPAQTNGLNYSETNPMWT